MNYYKLKIASSAFVVGTLILPPLTYKAAEAYIDIYQSISNSIAYAQDASLNYIGLTYIEKEPTLDELIRNTAQEFNLPPKLLYCLIQAESAKNPDAYSPKGAIGLAQIMPFNASRCGFKKISKLWDDSNNIRCGGQILREELDRAKGNLNLALQRYNGGDRCVNKCPESTNYAKININCFAQASL